jgi:hypothetical protein
MARVYANHHKVIFLLKVKGYSLTWLIRGYEYLQPLANGKIYAIGGADGNSVSEEYDAGYSDKVVKQKDKMAVSWGSIKAK